MNGSDETSRERSAISADGELNRYYREWGIFESRERRLIFQV